MECGQLGSSVHGILRQEYCSGLPYPPPGDRPDPGMEPGSLLALGGGLFITSAAPVNGGARVQIKILFV